MALPVYLAMTASEYSQCIEPPPYLCWMACHFSSYGKGLTNIPPSLPKNALLMINDQFPPNGHDPHLIAQQIHQAIESFQICGIIMDMQRPFDSCIQQIIDCLRACITCPFAVTKSYAKNWDGPIFLPPVPPSQTPLSYLKEWKNCEIWLELDSGDLSMILTEQGCKTTSESYCTEKPIFHDSNLHCHYHTALQDNSAIITLHRTKEDIHQLLEETEKMGVKLAVGLYQEFKESF